MVVRRAFLIGAALVIGIAVADMSSGQNPTTDNPPPTTGQATTTTQPAPAPQARRAKQVLGSKVSIQGDVSIGTVDDIIFNDDGYIEFLVVVNDGKLVAVPWQAAKFNFDRRVAIVNIPEQKFREVPTFTVQAYPNFYEPAYRTRIYTYYGVQPIDRRIERRIDRKGP